MQQRLLRLARLIVTGIVAFSALSRQAGAQDITSNLRGHWKLTETSGTVADDLSSFNRNGTYTNGVALASSTPVTLHNELAANFDGFNDYVAVPGESTYDITGAITVAAWIKVDVWDVQWQTIVSKGDTAWRLIRNNTTGGVMFACSGTSAVSVASTVAVNDGQWHHVVGVYTGGQLRIYIDGGLNNVVAATGAVTTNNLPVEIARNAGAAGREFDGAIYDVRVYNRALSANDITYLTTQGKPVGYWKLDESAGTTAFDSSGLAHNGTVTGTVDWTAAVRNNGHRFNYTNGDDYISLPSNSVLDNVQEADFTLTAWFQPLSTPPGSGAANDAKYGILMKAGFHTGIYYTELNRFAFEHFLVGNNGIYASSPVGSVYSPGKFYHVVGTVNRAAGTMNIYVDGVLSETTSFTPNTASRDYGAMPWQLGIANPGAGTYKWPAHGVIDDARIYYHAVTPSEVADLHGLIGHWKFGEGVGVSAADSTLKTNNAALSGGATWATDCAGNAALQTNGTGGIAQTATAFTPPSEGTVAFWMQPTGAATLGRIFGLSDNWEVRQLADGTMVFDLGAVGNTFSTTAPINEPGRWYHVTVTFDSADETFAIYIDGELHRTGVNPANMVQQSAGVLSLGTRTGNTEYWPGALRDFRVYNRRLPTAEISELADVSARWKFDEASGAVAVDSSGWARHGAVVGTAAWTQGKLNNAIQLDGATYVTASGLMNSPRNVTIAAWANLTSADTGGAELISLGDCLAIRLNSSGQSHAFFYNGSTWTSAAVNQTFAGAGWRHFAAVFDDDDNVFRFYINGAEVASVATTASISYSGLGANSVIGRHGNGSSTFDFTGKIDDARVYSRALCASQIMELVNDGGGAYQGVRVLQWVETR